MKQKLSPSNLLHDPIINDRVLIESLGNWRVLGTDRRHPAYEGYHKRGDTPIQLWFDGGDACGHSSILMGSTAVSIITPCLATNGRFEVTIGNAAPVRKCCYKCVRELLKRELGIETPDHKEWIVYMLLECHSYMNGDAPKELPDVR